MIDEDPKGKDTKDALTTIVQDAKWLEKRFPYMVLCVIAIIVIAAIVFLSK